MNKYLRAGAVTAATALLASPLAATADTGSATDSSDGGPAYANLTSIDVNHRMHRINTTLRMPVIREGRLAKTQVRIQRKGDRKVWTVEIARNRHGKVISKTLTFRKPGGAGGGVLGCGKIRTNVNSPGSMRISVPNGCILGKHKDKRIRAKGRIVARAGSGSLSVVAIDATRFTKYLARG